MEERIAQLEAEIVEMRDFINNLSSSNSVPSQMANALSYKNMRFSGEPASTYYKSVNEGSTGQYVVTDAIDGLINIEVEGRVVKVPYFT